MAKKKAATKEVRELTDQQWAAVDALVSGSTITAAADMAGVDRHTVSRWMNTDPVFIATLNQIRYATQAQNAEKLRNLAADAITVVQNSLKSIDENVRLKAAQYVLKTLGLSTVAAITREQTDAGYVEDGLHDENLTILLSRLRLDMEPPPASEHDYLRDYDGAGVGVDE